MMKSGRRGLCCSCGKESASRWRSSTVGQRSSTKDSGRREWWEVVAVGSSADGRCEASGGTKKNSGGRVVQAQLPDADRAARTAVSQQLVACSKGMQMGEVMLGSMVEGEGDTKG